MTSIDLQVWVDVACPWCYIVKHRLEHAIAASERPAEVTVRYRAYELDPDAPRSSGTSVLEHLAAMTGSVDASHAFVGEAADAARDQALDVDAEAQLRANTFDALRVVALGLAQGGPPLQAAVLERLFSAHFSEGRAVDDPTELQRLGAEAGLDERRLGSVLAGDDFAEQVREDEEAARDLGITRVPYVLAGDSLVVHGAQPTEVFADLLAKAGSAAAGSG